MVKLASARDCRLYGPRPVRKRWEYINAGLHVFASTLLAAGFSAQLPGSRSAAGLALVLVASALLALVNAHDFAAHAAGVDYRLGLVAYDLQLGLVEFAVPIVQTLGSALASVAVLLLLHHGASERRVADMLVAGTALWAAGAVGNACQIYERADGDTQVLQAGVCLPFLMGSLLFLVAGVCNRVAVGGAAAHREMLIMRRSWAWLCTVGSLLFLVGGLMNVVKVFRMQQRSEGLRLEKLRGGAQERLFREREGTMPILEDASSSSSRRRQRESSSSEELKRGAAVGASSIM